MDLPECYTYFCINENCFRANLFHEEDVFNWINEYSIQSCTSWNVKFKNTTSSRFVCRIAFICHHAAYKKVDPDSNKRGKSKNCDCKAIIDVLIKLTTKDTCKKDKHVKGGLPAIIRFKSSHNHTTNSAEALSLLKPSKETKSIFEGYFNSGLTAKEAADFHISNLQLDGENGFSLANAALNPKYRTVIHWYSQWKMKNLNYQFEDGILQPLKNGEEFNQVDVGTGFCSCDDIHLGKFCKHRGASFQQFDNAIPNTPATHTEASFEAAESSFYELLLRGKIKIEKEQSESEPLSSDKQASASEETVYACETENQKESGCAMDISEIDQTPRNTDFQHILQKMQQLHEIFGTPDLLLNQLDRHLDQIKSSAMWESFLNTAGSDMFLSQCSREKNSEQPTSLSRNRCKSGVARANKRLSVSPTRTVGNVAKESKAEEKVGLKRPKGPAQWKVSWRKSLKL